MDDDPGIRKARAAAGGRNIDLARLLGVSQSAISQWERVPIRRALQIEALTAGQVTKEELRPDLFVEPAARAPEMVSDMGLERFSQPEPCLDGRPYDRLDGRTLRSARARAAIVSACRALMQAGQFRPPMQACCLQAGCSVRIGSHTFKTIEILHLEAADDPPTRDAIVERVVGDERPALSNETLNRIVRALVTGVA